MRTFLITILVWAILFGLLGTGVKVMATSPEMLPVQTDTVEAGDNPDRVDLQRDGRNNAIMPTH